MVLRRECTNETSFSPDREKNNKICGWRNAVLCRILAERENGSTVLLNACGTSMYATVHGQNRHNGDTKKYGNACRSVLRSDCAAVGNIRFSVLRYTTRLFAERTYDCPRAVYARNARQEKRRVFLDSRLSFNNRKPHSRQQPVYFRAEQSA